MKKVYGYLGMLLVLTILISTTLVVAQTNFEVVGEKFGAISVMEDFDLGTKSSSVLLGILLFMILQSIFLKMEIFGKGSKTISATIALIVTLLTFIYVPDHLFDALATNYAALGATILTLFPFIIAIYFTVFVTTNLGLARVIWGIFFLYYLVLLAYTWGTNTYQTFNFLDPVNLPYEVALFASLVLFLVLGPLREKVWKGHVAGVKEKLGKKKDLANVGLNLLADTAEELSES